jgi:UDP-N-acetylglucosamine/UDP-N-acetylgalactosamine 4-epimerase
MNLTFLVTGSAGFIGSNLCDHLIRQGHKVIGLDNFSSGKQENIDRVMTSFTNNQYKFIKGDICNLTDIEECFSYSIDVVVHLAAQGSVQKSFTNVAYNNRQNIDGFLNMLKASGENRVAQFIYASSCAIYGNTNDLPISEKHRPDPVSPYASSKLMNDLLSHNLDHVYSHTSFTGLRFFNIFGPWQDPLGDYAAVVPKWNDLCISGRQPIIFGDGLATRDFCYVGNVCDLIESIGTKQSVKKANVYNVGSGISVTLNELYNGVNSALIKKGIQIKYDNPNYKPWRDGDIVHSLATIELAQKELEFIPKINLIEGLERILSEQYGL